MLRWFKKFTAAWRWAAPLGIPNASTTKMKCAAGARERDFAELDADLPALAEEEAAAEVADDDHRGGAVEYLLCRVAPEIESRSALL